MTVMEPNELMPDIDETRLNKLSEFIVSLVQAFLRTGYYTSEHPESEKARLGLYDRFTELLLKRGDLTFLAKDTEAKKQIFVEGMLPKPCDLKTLMLAGMAELYDEKLIEFLNRKELISLTLKQKMAEKEFYDFIDVMSEPILTDIHDKRKRDRFIFHLQERGIKNVSFVFNEDLIRLERNIPWRAWIALSRLNKDISLIPILRNLEQEDLKTVQREIVSDVLRPLQDPKLSFATLVNSDLIHSKVMEEEEIEEDIVCSLSDDMLTANVEEYIYSSSQLKRLVNEKAYEEKLLRILDRFKERLKESGEGQSEICLRKLYKNRMISFDELPPRLQEEETLRQFLENFLNDPDAVLSRLDQSKDDGEYDAFMKSVSGIMPWLIEKGRFREFHKILRVVKEYAKEGGKRGEQASATLEQIGSGVIPFTLKDAFMSGKKEVRLTLLPIFLDLENQMTLHLLAVIKETEDKWVRKNAIEIFLQMGPGASLHLEEALKTERFPGEVVGDVLKAIVTAGHKEVKAQMAPVVSEYTSHQDPYVRKYALGLLADVHRINAEETLLNALKDSNTEVRKSAITYLGMVKSKKALPAFSKMLSEIMKSTSKDDEQVENQIYWALGFLRNDYADGEETPEKLLLEALQQRGQTGRFSKLLGRKGTALSDQSMGIICDSLGTIGTKMAEPVLTDLAKNKKPWGTKAQQALRKIRRRE